VVETVRSLRSIALPAYGPTALGSIGTGAVLPVVVLSGLPPDEIGNGITRSR